MSKVIKRMRQRIASKEWLKNKLKSLIDETEEWHTFEQFDCDSFFKGDIAAERNKQIYHKNVNRIDRQIKFINELLTSHQGNK